MMKVDEINSATTHVIINTMSTLNYFLYIHYSFLHKKKPQPSISQGLRDILYLMKF